MSQSQVDTAIAPPSHSLIKRLLKTFEAEAEYSLNGPLCPPITVRVSVSESLNSRFPSQCDLSQTVSTGSPVRRSPIMDQGKLTENPGAQCHRIDSENAAKNSSIANSYSSENLRRSHFTPPFLLPMDMPAKVVVTKTVVEGHSIVGFVVGGEMRLCLPQILNTILDGFSLSEINAVCDELHIFCSRCGTAQLETLKRDRVLPTSAHGCGLITRTDAERLCSILLHRYGESSDDSGSETIRRRKLSKGELGDKLSISSGVDVIRVSHECFGKCRGVFLPSAYVDADSRAILCSECSGAFSPAQFVCHSHSPTENRTVHWGFESSNWRKYLRPVHGRTDTDCDHVCTQKMWDAVQAKFNITISEGTKRRQTVADSSDEYCMEAKRVKWDVRNRDNIDIASNKPGADGHVRSINTGTKDEASFHPSNKSCDSSDEISVAPGLNCIQKISSTLFNGNDSSFPPNVSLERHPAAASTYDIISDVESGEREEEDYREERPSTQVVDGYPADSASSLRPRHAEEYRGFQYSSSSTVKLTAEAKLAGVFETELNIFRSALKHSGPVEVKEMHLRDFVTQQQIELVLVGDLLHTNRIQQQELKYLYGLIKEKELIAARDRRAREQELVNLRASCEVKLQDASREIADLRSEREARMNGTKRSDVGLMKAKYKAQAEHRRRQLQAAELDNAQLSREVTDLRVMLQHLLPFVPPSHPPPPLPPAAQYDHSSHSRSTSNVLSSSSSSRSRGYCFSPAL